MIIKYIVVGLCFLLVLLVILINLINSAKRKEKEQVDKKEDTTITDKPETQSNGQVKYTINIVKNKKSYKSYR